MQCHLAMRRTRKLGRPGMSNSKGPCHCAQGSELIVRCCDTSLESTTDLTGDFGEVPGRFLVGWLMCSFRFPAPLWLGSNSGFWR